MIRPRDSARDMRSFAWVLAAFVVALTLGWGAGSSPYLAIGVGTALAAAALWASRMSPKYWVLIGILAVFASSSSLTENAAFSVAARMAGLSAIAIGGLIAKTDVLSPGVDVNRFSAGRFSSILLPLLAFLAFAALPHGQYFQFAGYLVGVVLIWTALWGTTYVSRDHLKFALEWGLGGVVLGSIVVGYVFPSIGIEGERLRGFTNNANLLGFYSWALAGLILLGGIRGVTSIVWLVSSVVSIFGSASRASMLAVLVIIGVGAVLHAGMSRRLAISAALLIIPIMAIWFEELAALDIALFRDNNSRDSSFENALELFYSSPLSGIGIDDSLVIASSPLRALAYAGVWGGISIACIYGGMLWLSFRVSNPALVFALAATVHSFFEGWLLSPISPLFVIFMLCLVLLIHSARVQTSPSVSARDHPSRGIS